MHLGHTTRMPLSVQRPLDLRRQLQQQAVVGLLGLRMDAQRQTVFLPGHGHRDARHAAQVGQRGVGKVAPQVVEPIEHRGVVAGRQLYHRVHFGRGQCGDGREDDVPVFKELARRPRGGVEHRLHAGPLGEAGVQAHLPDLDVDRLHQVRWRASQAARGQQVGNRLREIADVARRFAANAQPKTSPPRPLGAAGRKCSSYFNQRMN